ncbi:glycosyl hydrolase [Halosimplex aquaticum]
MLLAGSDDGVYRLPDLDGSAERTAEQELWSGRVVRLRQFDAIDGVFAASTTALCHSPDGETWIGLGVPREQTYAVGALPDGRLYAGTRPAHVYAGEFEYGARAGPTDDVGPFVDWVECEGFQDLPARDEWRLPRHENLAQVRDLHHDPAAPERLVAGVEVGGVHVSDDRGETWEERREGWTTTSTNSTWSGPASTSPRRVSGSSGRPTAVSRGRGWTKGSTSGTSGRRSRWTGRSTPGARWRTPRRGRTTTPTPSCSHSETARWSASTSRSPTRRSPG